MFFIYNRGVFCHSEQSEESGVILLKPNISDSSQAQNDKKQILLSKHLGIKVKINQNS